MPVSPDLAEQLAAALVSLYSDTEATLLAMVADRLADGIDDVGWQERKLGQVQNLRREVEQALAELRRTGSVAIAEAIQQAYTRGAATAAGDLAAAGMAPGAAFGTVNLPTVDALITATIDQVESTHLRILRSTVDGYRQVVADTAGQVATGTLTRRQAAQRSLDRFAGRGITGFVDKAGRSWDLASYAEMSMRTATGRAAVTGHVNQLVANDRDLVMVSDAPQECEVCRPWEGKVLSLGDTGKGTVEAFDIDDRPVKVQVAGTLRQAVSDGLFHANCRHRLVAFTPGVTRRLKDTADPDGDVARQELRRQERELRKWRRREAAAIDPKAKAQAKAKVTEWRGKIKHHTDTTSAKRQPDRELISNRKGTAGPPTTPAPAPKPVIPDDAFTTPTGRTYRPGKGSKASDVISFDKGKEGTLRPTVDHIDRLHSTGDVPVSVKMGGKTKGQGGAYGRQGIPSPRPSTGKFKGKGPGGSFDSDGYRAAMDDWREKRANGSPTISINKRNGESEDHPIVFAHEFGHHLDIQGGDSHFPAAARRVNMAERTNPLAQPDPESAFLVACRQTEAYAKCRRGWKPDYTTSPEELWARAYSQWVMRTSSDPAMATALDIWRRPPVNDGLQWADDEFDTLVAPFVEGVLESWGLIVRVLT